MGLPSVPSASCARNQQQVSSVSVCACLQGTKTPKADHRMCGHPVVGFGYSTYIPVVPHKAVAEASKIGKPIGEVSCCESRMAERIH